MRLVSFDRAGERSYGALVDGAVVDLRRAEPRLPETLLELLAAGTEALDRARAALGAAGAEDHLALDSVHLLAPIPRPGKILCVGLNYRDHAAESHAATPEYPTIFAKYANTVVGPRDPIVLPRVTAQVDYEGELGVVIGRRARYLREPEALAYVAGYLTCNDVSARDYQSRTSQWTVGKSFDGFAPMGPSLVTADEVPDPQDLDLRVSIGADVLQSSNTRHMIFPVARVIAYLTEAITLEPGDVIMTGTPAGVGAARTPQRFLKAGETVRVEIERLGALENPVIAEGATQHSDGRYP